MNIKFWNQPKNVCLGDILNEKLKKGFDEVLFVVGMAKDSGVDMIYDSLCKAKHGGSDVNFYIGIDKKNTSKDMLSKLLELDCNLNVHINKEEEKVETRIYVFENKNAESFVYMCSSKFSGSGLTNNNCLIEEIFYSAEDRKLFENFKAVLLQGIEKVFKIVLTEEIKLLAERGEIVARITDRKIPSISELYGESSFNSIESIGNQIYDENSGIKLFEIPESNVDIDVDIDFSGESKAVELPQEFEAKNDRLAEEKFTQIFNNKESETKKVSIVKDSDDIDFSNVKIFVFETNKILEKGLGKSEIKIPNYLYKSMLNFFDVDGEIETIVDKNGKEKFIKKVILNILDVLNNDRLKDESAIMVDTGKYFAIKSSVIENMKIEENDIIRMIKNDNCFDVEVIRKGAKEYQIWENFCKCTMRNSKRRFGIM